MTSTTELPDHQVGATFAVEVQNVRKVFAARKAASTVEAVRGVDLRIAPGEVVALLGPNGAGKTTLLDMILGFTEPTSGTVSVLGVRPVDAIATGAISSVMQSGGLLPRLTVGETLAMVGDLFGRAKAVESVAARAGIEGILRRRVSQCSGGEQQRLRFALALLPDPDLLLLDEPTTGLDVRARREFWAAIRDDAARGTTIVFATHYLAEADDIADRIVLMSEGRIVADGTPAQISGHALGRRIRAYLPDASGDDALRSRGDVDSLERQGETVILGTRDSDALARHMFGHTTASHVEIVSNPLEAAFVSLTGEDQR